jgi:dTDP-4-dehydrorhamnose 3,5-epimerase
MPFTFEATNLPGVIVVQPRSFSDERGYFLETYKKSDFESAGIHGNFVQENHSKSMQSTLRGLHAQRSPKAQDKFVRVVEGEIFDVAVDMRRDSTMFGRWISVVLSAENRRSLFVPAGCLHGFCVTSPEAQVIYKTTNEYAPELEYGVRWDDATLSIPWPVITPRLSERDQRWPSLEELLNTARQAT